MEPLRGSRWAWFLILPPNAVFSGDLLAPRTLHIEQGTRYMKRTNAGFVLVEVSGLPVPYAGYVLSSW